MSSDPWPQLVQQVTSRASSGGQLLEEFERHVAHMSRPYPDAYFALGRKEPAAVQDLTHRAYTSCARIPKGRYPFDGRVPFEAFVAEDYDGRTMRYHAIYGRLSIAREILRDDYARNIRRDPILAWRARVYKRIGEVLEERAERAGGGKPTRWRLPAAKDGPKVLAMRAPEVAVARLRGRSTEDFDALVLDALCELGTATRGQICTVLTQLLDPPPAPPDEPQASVPNLDTEIAVREAVTQAWEALDEEARDLLRALARGASYREVMECFPRLRNKVAVSRAVSKLARGFVAELEGRFDSTSDRGRPRQIVERVLDVLAEIDPELSS